jgi:hypothetical protein
MAEEIKKLTMDDLTPEIMAKIPEYREKCRKDLYSGVEFANFNLDEIIEYIEKIYSLCDFKKPVIIIAQDPTDYKKIYSNLQQKDSMKLVEDLFNVKNDCKTKMNANMFNALNEQLNQPYTGQPLEIKSHYLFLCSTYHRVYLTWYKFIQDEFNIKHANKETLDWFYKRAFNNISRCFFTEQYVLVLRMPKYIRRNEIGFHNVHGASIEWEDYKIYHINGRKIPADIFNAVANQTMSFEDFNKIDDEDIKASIVTMITERFGNEELMKFLDAKVVDEQTINHSSGHSEVVRLWKTNKKYEFINDLNGNTNQPYAWLDLTCPSTGSKYLIATSAHFKDAIEACKFHRPQSIPIELKYDFNSFNN